MVYVIAAVAIVLLGLRPWRLPGWIWPAGGALLAVTIGAEPARAAVAAIAGQWNVLLFILGLMVLSAAAEESGAFEWITHRLLEVARGSRRRLFVYLFLTGAAVTLVLSNDATAIALTPIVYRAVVKGGRLAPEPFLFACVFIANTASFGLPFSNPANVLILPHAQLGDYVHHLGPPQLAAIAINLAVLLFFFRRELQGGYAVPTRVMPGARTIRTLAAMLALVAAYVFALLKGWSLGPVAAVGSTAISAIAFVNPNRIARRISWGTFALLAGLFVLLDAVTRAGFTQWALTELGAAARYGALAIDAIAAGGAALLSNALNNLPVAVASSYVVAHPPTARLAYALILGVDVGPNLFTTGSLATILWLSVLRGYGMQMSRRQYLRLGLLVVPATLAAGILWLWLLGLDP